MLSANQLTVAGDERERDERADARKQADVRGDTIFSQESLVRRMPLEMVECVTCSVTHAASTGKSMDPRARRLSCKTAGCKTLERNIPAAGRSALVRATIGKETGMPGCFGLRGDGCMPE